MRYQLPGTIESLHCCKNVDPTLSLSTALFWITLEMTNTQWNEIKQQKESGDKLTRLLIEVSCLVGQRCYESGVVLQLDGSGYSHWKHRDTWTHIQWTRVSSLLLLMMMMLLMCFYPPVLLLDSEWCTCQWLWPPDPDPSLLEWWDEEYETPENNPRVWALKRKTFLEESAFV